VTRALPRIWLDALSRTSGVAPAAATANQDRQHRTPLEIHPGQAVRDYYAGQRSLGVSTGGTGTVKLHSLGWARAGGLTAAGFLVIALTAARSSPTLSTASGTAPSSPSNLSSTAPPSPSLVPSTVPPSPAPWESKSVIANCALGFDGGIEDLLPLTTQYEGYPTGEQVFITNDSSSGFIIWGFYTEIIYGGQVTSTQEVTGATYDGSPGGAPGHSLPWYLPPGQTFHPVVDLDEGFPSQVHVSSQVYLGSTCKVVAWF